MKASFYLIISIVFLFEFDICEDVELFSGDNIENIDCDLLPRLRTNTASSFSMREIDSSDYKPETYSNPYKLTLFSNSDSIEKTYSEDYPEIFKKTDKGYRFKSKGGSDIIVENNLKQEKSYSKYEFKAKFKNYVIILRTYFEGNEVVLVNLDTGFAFITIGKPRFITETYVYSFADYYGDSDIDLFNIKTSESIRLSFDNISIVDSYNLSNHIYFKAICLNSMEEKYFEILNYR